MPRNYYKKIVVNKQYKMVYDRFYKIIQGQKKKTLVYTNSYEEWGITRTFCACVRFLCLLLQLHSLIYTK